MRETLNGSILQSLPGSPVRSLEQRAAADANKLGPKRPPGPQQVTVDGQVLCYRPITVIGEGKRATYGVLIKPPPVELQQSEEIDNSVFVGHTTEMTDVPS